MNKKVYVITIEGDSELISKQYRMKIFDSFDKVYKEYKKVVSNLRKAAKENNLIIEETETKFSAYKLDSINDAYFYVYIEIYEVL